MVLVRHLIWAMTVMTEERMMNLLVRIWRKLCSFSSMDLYCLFLCVFHLMVAGAVEAGAQKLTFYKNSNQKFTFLRERERETEGRKLTKNS